MLDDLIRWCNDNQGFASAVLAAVTILIAIGGTVIALLAFRQSERQHRDAVRPIIVFHLARYTYDDNPPAHLIVKNVGLGPALNGRLDWDGEACAEIGLTIVDPGYPLVIKSGDDLVIDVIVDGIGAAISLSSDTGPPSNAVRFEYQDVYERSGHSTAELAWSSPTDIDLTSLKMSKTKVSLS
jgi:hypothetical protein